MAVKLIGISGRKRCGKDTIADILSSILEARESAPDVIRVAFADAPKKAVASMLGYQSAAKMEASFPLGKEHPLPLLGNVTLRKMYQTLGTGWGRKMIGTDIWVKVLHNQIKDHLRPGSNTVVIVTDVRYDNEAEYIRNHGGLLIHVERPSVEPKGWRTWFLHSSERRVKRKPKEIIVVNDGTKEQLFIDVWVVVSELL